MAYTKTFKTLPPAGKWTGIEVSQTLVDSKYIYSISISNKIVFKVQNKKPVELSKVKVYAGSPWYEARCRGHLFEPRKTISSDLHNFKFKSKS